MVQNFFIRLSAIAGSYACAVLENQEGLLQRRDVAESPGSWLPAGTKPAPRVLTQGSGVGHREAFWAKKSWSCYLQDSLGRPSCAGLGTGSQTGAHKQGGPVSGLCSDRLPVID